MYHIYHSAYVQGSTELQLNLSLQLFGNTQEQWNNSTANVYMYIHKTMCKGRWVVSGGVALFVICIV